MPEHRVTDWDGVRRMPEYRRLRTLRNRIVAPITVIYLAGYFGFLILSVADPPFLGTRLHGGINVAYVLMTGVFVLVWAVAYVYVRLADRRLDGRSSEVTDAAKGHAAAPAGEEPR